MNENENKTTMFGIMFFVFPDFGMEGLLLYITFGWDEAVSM